MGRYRRVGPLALLDGRTGGVLLTVLLALAGASDARSEPTAYAGRPLDDVLLELQQQGVPLVFSSELVQAAMRVEREPRSSEPPALLEQLLAPHGLRAVAGAGGTWVVVRRADPERASALGATSAITAAAPERVLVTAPRFRLYAPDADDLSAEEIDSRPHLADDIYRFASQLPGMAAGDISARFHVRGGEESEILVRLDGMDLYEPFHLKNLQSAFSIVDSNLIGNLDLHTGVLPVRLGGALSGAMELRSMRPTPPQVYRAGVSFVNAFVGAQGAVEPGAAWLVSARTGYLEYILDFVDPNGDINPAYQDAFARFEWNAGEQDQFAGHLLWSNDANTFEGDSHEQELSIGESDGRYAWLAWARAWTPQIGSSTVLGGTELTDLRRGGFFEAGEKSAIVRDERRLQVALLRTDWAWSLSPRQRLGWGAELRSERADLDYAGHFELFDPVLIGDSPPVVTDRLIDLRPARDAWAAHAEFETRVAEHLTINIGARVDDFGHADSAAEWSPRLHLVYTPGVRTIWRASFGEHVQAQRLDELDVEDGVTEYYAPQVARIAALGVERRIADGVWLTVDLYDKRIDRPQPRYENLFDPIELFPEAEPDRRRVDSERARLAGVEAGMRGRRRDSLQWWLTYTYSSARDEVQGRWEPRSWDQPHAVSAGAIWSGDKWDFSVSALYHSGWPTTEANIVMETLPDGTQRPRPVLGAPNAARYADFRVLDARLSRRVAFDNGELQWYVEVRNLFNRENPCCVDSFDLIAQPDGSISLEREEDHWLPFVPSFGVIWTYKRR